MTIDRAIETLDPEHRENYDGMEAMESDRLFQLQLPFPG